MLDNAQVNKNNVTSKQQTKNEIVSMFRGLVDLLTTGL